MDDLEEIKNRIDIVDFISGYVPLKQAGRNFKALCPFHTEKTPSFIVSRERQLWRCFGACSEGGDIFGFLMKMEGLSFGEALKVLADKAGVQIRPTRIAKQDSRVRFFQINEVTAQFFHKMLLETPNGEKALEYLLKRGLNKTTIQTFMLGWAPNASNFLSSFLIQKGFSAQYIKEAGLATDQNEVLRDFFRGRIIFPIRTPQGHIAGFTGRKLEEESFGPKYLNSPPTPVFDKSSLLFGFEEAKQEIRQKNETILVEGNMDVLACFQAGIKNVVASCGTALTEKHIDLIKRFTSNLILCFDSDEAGEVASKRAIEIAEPKELNIKVITISFAKDPADALKKDAAKFKKLIADAKYATDFLFERIFEKNDINSAIGKKQIAKEALLLIKKLPDIVEQFHYLKKLAQKLDVSEQILMNFITKKRSYVSDIEKVAPTAVSKEEIEEKILGLILMKPDFFEILTRHLLARDFSPKFQPLYKLLLKFYNNNLLDLKALDHKIDTKAKKQIDFLVIDAENKYQDFSDEEILTEILLHIKRLKDFDKTKKQTELIKKIKEAEEKKDTKTSLKLLTELQNLIKEE